MLFIFKVIICIYIFIFLIYTCKDKTNINKIWTDFIEINNNNKYSCILFYPFVGCGFANKIPTLQSSILLSLVSFHPLFIVNWKQLLFYFHFPLTLFIQHYNHSSLYTYNRKKNISILNLLKINVSIKIHTYHSFTKYILICYNLTKNLKMSLKKKQKDHITLEMLLQQIFFKPTDSIKKYIYNFKIKANKEFIVGIHIRTGYLSDFGEKDKRFFNNNSITLYIQNINKILYKYKHSKLLFLSDSTVIKRMFFTLYTNKLFNFSIPGRICHARDGMHGKLELNDCVVKLIAENYILSECKIIIGSGSSSYFGMACRRNNVKSIKI